MQEAILETLGTLQRCIQLISIQDLIDMGIIAYVIYRGMKLLKDTSAMRLAKGILIIFAAQIVAESLQLNTVSWILQQVFSFGALFLAIVFQPELRRMLEQLGKGQGQLRKFLTGTEVDVVAIEQCINQTVAACESMSWTRTGALMVFERQERLSEIITTGTRIDAEPSEPLIKNIFSTIHHFTTVRWLCVTHACLQQAVSCRFPAIKICPAIWAPDTALPWA